MFLSMVGSVQFCQLETGFPKRLMGNIFIKFSELNKKMKAVFFPQTFPLKILGSSCTGPNPGGILKYISLYPGEGWGILKGRGGGILKYISLHPGKGGGILKYISLYPSFKD